MSPPPRALVVAYYFPPVGGGGVTRTLRVVASLAHAGWVPVVLTVDGAAWPQDASRLAEVPHAARLLRLPNPDWGRIAARRGGSRSDSRLAKGGGRLRRWLVPDLHVGWSTIAALPAAVLAAFRAVDLVYTTAPPYSSAAAGLAARRLGLPWIADFRDGWTCCPTRTDLPERRVAFERRLEDAVLRGANRVLFASSAVRNRCAARVASLDARSETLLTGFDAAEFAADRPTSPPRGGFEIVHAGSILGARRTATLGRFLEALRLWIRREPAAARDVRVRFLGAETEVASALAASGLGHLVEWRPAVPRRALPAALRAAHLCLALQPAGPRGGDPIPGKLFDAAGAHRPVLGLAAPGPFRDLVARLRIGAVLDPLEPDAVARLLASARRRVRRGASALPVDASGFEALSSERFSRRIVAICQELVGLEGGPCPSA